ncbi:hypothetical protein [Brochothrix thermosphacta]|uniref:hypothetical protein n=1 Tax=Brochothrix thermosphacta TaxID=2756 RepID=UPI001C4FEF9C|nr:hypothetical protein [Brochothrix thermosphacta]
MTENIKDPSKEQKERALEYVIYTINTDNPHISVYVAEGKHLGRLPEGAKTYGEIIRDYQNNDKDSVKLALKYLFSRNFISHEELGEYDLSLPYFIKDITSEDNNKLILEDNWLPNKSKYIQGGFGSN